MPIPTYVPPAPGGGPGVPGQFQQQRYATLGDRTFGAADEFGTLVYLNDIQGWESIGTTGQITQRSADHGGWADPAYLTPRVVELTLTLVGGSFYSVQQSIEAITAAVPINDLGTLTIGLLDFDGRSADVRQGGDVLVAQRAATATMSLSLVAPDPRRYSPIVSTYSTGLGQSVGGLVVPVTPPVTIGATVILGGLTLTNAGNMATPPVFTVVGPCAPGSITHNSGRTLRWNETIPAGRTLTIDTATRTALLDGTAQRVVTGSWFQLDPGENVVAFAATSYDADSLLSVSYRHSWR